MRMKFPSRIRWAWLILLLLPVTTVFGAWIIDGSRFPDGAAPVEKTFPVLVLELGGAWTDFELKASVDNFESLVYFIQVPIHEAVAKEVGLEVPNTSPISNTAPLPADARAWPEMTVRGKPISLDTVSFTEFSEVKTAGVEKVPGFASLSGIKNDASDLLENLVVKPFNAEANSLVAVLRPFRPHRLTRSVEAHWALSPLRVWRGGALGRLQAAADDALEEGDVQQAEVLKTRYWKWLEIAVERRAVFEKSSDTDHRTGVEQDGGL